MDAGSSCFFFFGRGFTIACFHSLGTRPFSRERDEIGKFGPDGITPLKKDMGGGAGSIGAPNLMLLKNKPAHRMLFPFGDGFMPTPKSCWSRHLCLGRYKVGQFNFTLFLFKMKLFLWAGYHPLANA